jgi:hypothetical protein
MRRIDLLIDEARRETDNTIFTDSTGIQTSEFLRWANSAQTRILSLVQQAHPDLFQRSSVIAGVVNQEEYSIPSKTFLGTRVQMVEYSKTGLARDYYPLKKGNLHERVNGPSGDPAFYIRFSKKILIQPAPQNGGSFRLITQLALPRLDVRRATVLSSTLDTVTNTITTLNFDPSIEIDQENIQNEGYICIVDKDGNQMMEAIPVDAVDMTTGLVTVTSGFTFQSGETIPVGSFAVLGSYSSTTSDLPDVAERYVVDFMIWKLEKRDSNTASQEISQELKDQEQDIVDSFGMADDDVSYVAILDPQYLDYGDGR